MDHSNAIVYGPKIESWQEELEKMSLDEYMVTEVPKRSNDILFLDAITEETLRVNEFLRRSYSLAAELQAIGCNKDTIVGIITENRSEYLIVVLGTLLTGATLTTYNPEYSVSEFRPIFNIASPTVIFCSVACRDKVIESTKTPSVVKNTPDQTAFILYSSGTTGLPKGVMLTHRNWVFMMKLMVKYQLLERHGSMVTLPTFMCHIGGLTNLLSAVFQDEVMVVMQKLADQRLFLSVIQKYKIKHSVVFPRLIIFLVKDAAVDEYDLSSLEFLTYAGAPIKPETERALKKMTTYITRTHPANLKVNSCGSPVPGTQIKIVDVQTGRILGKNEIGEMYLKGPQMMKGYYRNEKVTAETIDKDGWLHSGDIAYYDDDGDFFIVDRAKELIKCGGYQISPAELEALLLTHPSISDVAVIGVPDENATELPRAYVVKKSGTMVTEGEVIKYLTEKALSPYKRLQGGVEFVSEIPRNLSGKILRKKLRELWNERQ